MCVHITLLPPFRVALARSVAALAIQVYLSVSKARTMRCATVFSCMKQLFSVVFSSEEGETWLACSSRRSAGVFREKHAQEAPRYPLEMLYIIMLNAC